MSTKLRAGSLALALLLTAACSSAPEPAADVAAGVRAEVPRPLNVQDPATVPSPPAPPSCDPRASLRPRGAIPKPGHMPAGHLKTIQDRGRLLVGIDQNAYLFGFRDPKTGELGGFEIEIAKEIARGIFGDPEAIQFRAITTADRIPVLQRGEVDIVVRTMTMTCERWQQVSFSTEYLTSRQKLLVNRGSGIKSFDDLAGRKVCATKGSTSLRVIKAAASHPIPVGTDSTLDCLVLLEQGQVDAVSTIDVLLAGLAAQDPGTIIVGEPLSNEPSGIGIPKDKDSVELVRFVNAQLERIRGDGTWKRIYQRWLTPALGPAPAPPAPVYRD